MAVSEVKKTPAHRTRQEAIAQDDEDDWYGNDKADYYAKGALAGTGKDGSDYMVTYMPHTEFSVGSMNVTKEY